MDDRKGKYRRSWLRTPLGEPAHSPGDEALVSDLDTVLAPDTDFLGRERLGKVGEVDGYRPCAPISRSG
jgi:hypothetical protein